MTKTPITDRTRDRLYAAAPALGGALAGIETIAELVSAGITEMEMEPGNEVGQLLTTRRLSYLVAAAGVLAAGAKRDLRGVIGESGENRLLWGSEAYLSGEYLRTAQDLEGAA
ncbi:MAG: hypothetical protein WBG92_14930 [Thiohalocapsa sp.]